MAATRSLVSSIALAELRDVEAARDVAQDVYVQIWNDLGALRNPQSFLPFLRQVTRQRARRVAERRGREVRGSGADAPIEAAGRHEVRVGARMHREVVKVVEVTPGQTLDLGAVVVTPLDPPGK